MLLRSLVNLAHELGLGVVTEGVADRGDADELVRMGCEYVQSFLFGTPLSPEAAQRLLAQQNAVVQA